MSSAVYTPPPVHELLFVSAQSKRSVTLKLPIVRCDDAVAIRNLLFCNDHSLTEELPLDSLRNVFEEWCNVLSTQSTTCIARVRRGFFTVTESVFWRYMRRYVKIYFIESSNHRSIFSFENSRYHVTVSLFLENLSPFLISTLKFCSRERQSHHLVPSIAELEIVTRLTMVPSLPLSG